MQLLDHLNATGEKVQEFAERIGEPHNTIRKIAYRQRQPSLPLAVKIAAATGGVVTPEDMLLPVVAPCGSCDRREESPEIASCTRIDCPMRAVEDEREAA